MEVSNSSEEPYGSGHDFYNYGCMDIIDDYFSYAERYKKSGDILVEWVERQRGLADEVIQPLCYLYLQYLELALKSIMADCSVLLEKSEKPELTHDIKKHWEKCKRLLKKIYSEELSDKICEIDTRIQRFLTIAPSHDAFRYPLLKNQRPSFPKQHYVNIRILREEINEIWSFFFGISNDITEKLKQGL